MRLIEAVIKRDVTQETVKVEMTLAELMVIQSMTYRFDGARLANALEEDFDEEVDTPWKVRDTLQIDTDNILSKKGVDRN